MSPLPPSDEDLVLYLYGEGDPATRATLERELASSPELAERLAAWQRILDLVPPPAAMTRGDDYGATVWARLAPQPVTPAAPPLGGAVLAGPWRRYLPLAAAAVVLVAAGFLAGRSLPPPAGPVDPVAVVGPTAQLPALSAAARERILASAVVTHLEQAEMLLLEVANGNADPAVEANRAAVLTAANRLYRGAATQAGAGDVADLLASLERLLLDVAHLPADADAATLAAVSERLATADLLFKVRIVQARLRHESAPSRGGQRTDERRPGTAQPVPPLADSAAHRNPENPTAASV